MLLTAASSDPPRGQSGVWPGVCLETRYTPMRDSTRKWVKGGYAQKFLASFFGAEGFDVAEEERRGGSESLGEEWRGEVLGAFDADEAHGSVEVLTVAEALGELCSLVRVEESHRPAVPGSGAVLVFEGELGFHFGQVQMSAEPVAWPGRNIPHLAQTQSVAPLAASSSERRARRSSLFTQKTAPPW